MKNSTLFEILKELPLYGVCSFADIENNLLPCRAKSRLPENAKSVIVAAFPYLLPKECYEGSNISKYAVPRDYHDYVVPLLSSLCNKLSENFSENKFVPFADNSPIPEVDAACLAGLGVKGLNSLLITEKYGSFVFVGEIVTDMFIEPTGDKIKECEKCGKCVSACPGKAISEKGIDKEKCLSHITQKKGELREEEINLIKKSGCIWGCDICQNVCPYNKNPATTNIEEFLAGAEPVLDFGTSLEGRAFGWRGKATVERNIKLYHEHKGF